jgi:hypothetical protein
MEKKRARKSGDYDANGAKLVFEVPCELPNVTTAYRYIKQEKFGGVSPFNKRYHGDYFAAPRTRQAKKRPEAPLERDNGIFISNLCTADRQGVSLLNNFLDHQDLFHVKCEVTEFNQSKRPTCLAVNKQPFKDGEHEEVAMIIGTSDGQILKFDPVLLSQVSIKKYNQDFEKPRQVDIVRWLDRCPSKPSSSRFMVVYSDGMVALYHKDTDVPQTGAKGEGSVYDPDKDMVKLDKDQMVSKLQVMKKMRTFVEDYSFDEALANKKKI